MLKNVNLYLRSQHNESFGVLFVHQIKYQYEREDCHHRGEIIRINHFEYYQKSKTIRTDGKICKTS